MLKGIIFDLDGVIVDSHPAHLQAWQEFFRGIGREIPERELSFVLEGRKREEILRHFLGDVTAEELRECGRRKEALFRQHAGSVKTVPGVEEVLDQLQETGVEAALASSAARQRIAYMLKDFGLETRFRVVVSGDDVAAGKPDPAIFRLAAEGLGLAPENLLVCEDAVCGVEAAKEAGMKCLAIAANGRAKALRAAGADMIVADFRQVSVEKLRGLFGGRTVRVRTGLE
jgi:beta-phosphoglucomutase